MQKEVAVNIPWKGQLYKKLNQDDSVNLVWPQMGAYASGGSCFPLLYARPWKHLKVLILGLQMNFSE